MYTPRQCGVKYDPPTLVLYYVVKATGKVHRRSMPLRNFTANSNVEETVTGLKEGKHQRYLEDVPNELLQKLLSMIQEKNSKIKNPNQAKTEGNNEQNDAEDLNKLSDDELDKRKAEMDKVFEKNRLRPSDEGFEYDIDVEFEGGKNISGWDSDDYSEPDF